MSSYLNAKFIYFFNKFNDLDISVFGNSRKFGQVGKGPENTGL